jgi:ADP-heptose:LPS heptosyltransferase
MRYDGSLAKRGNGAFRRVAVFRALQLGDMLCAVPALRALRAALPEAEIVLVGLPWAREFADRYRRYLDGFKAFPGYPGLPERAPVIDGIPAFLAAMQTERFDLAIQLHGSGRLTNPLTLLFGARHTAGFFPAGATCADVDWFAPWPDQGLEIHRLLGLMEFLGAPACGDELEFPLGDGDMAALWTVPETRRLEPGRYVCVHPGASCATRRWPAERFAAVARRLAHNGVSVVLTVHRPGRAHEPRGRGRVAQPGAAARL